MDPVHRKKYFYGGYKSADNGATVALFATNLAPPPSPFSFFFFFFEKFIGIFR